MNRRTVLTRVALVVGGVGLALVSIPLIRYFLPSKRAEALGAPVAVDLSTFRSGEVRSVLWRGPAPRNLGVPPHTFVSATELIIGIDNVAS